MNILASANNPGGMNAIMPVVQQLIRDGHRMTSIMEGAAKKICDTSKIEYIDADELSATELNQTLTAHTWDIFIAGTSMGYTIDVQILEFCKRNSIPSIYILDYWCNYFERFSMDKKTLDVLPDYICVMDELARDEMLEQGFPARSIVVTGNPYFDVFTDNIDLSQRNKNRVLFISAPLSEFKDYHEKNPYGYDEYTAIRDLVSIFNTIPSNMHLVIRLHPRDEHDKYAHYIHPPKVQLDDTDDIDKSLSLSGLVIGMNSIVLMQSALAKIPTISYQPNLKKDILATNRIGLTTLISDTHTLRKTLSYYGDHYALPETQSKGSFKLIEDATQNVINFIHSIT